MFRCDSENIFGLSHDVTELCENDSKSGSTNVVFENLLRGGKQQLHDVLDDKCTMLRCWLDFFLVVVIW